MSVFPVAATPARLAVSPGKSAGFPDFLSLPTRLPVCVPSRIALSLTPWDAEKCAALRLSSQ